MPTIRQSLIACIIMNSHYLTIITALFSLSLVPSLYADCSSSVFVRYLHVSLPQGIITKINHIQSAMFYQIFINYQYNFIVQCVKKTFETCARVKQFGHCVNIFIMSSKLLDYIYSFPVVFIQPCCLDTISGVFSRNILCEAANSHFAVYS